MLKIDSRELRSYSRSVALLGNDGLPRAVRKSLNKAAYMSKAETYPEVLNDRFTIRRPTYIRSHVIYKKVNNGVRNINKMESRAGFKKGKSRAGDQMELHETGGSISDRDIPRKTTRVSNSMLKKQRRAFFYRNFAGKKKGTYRLSKRKFIRITDRTIYTYRTSGSGRRRRITQRTQLYLLDRNVQIKKDPFADDVGRIQVKNIPKYYIEEAIKEIQRSARL